MSLNLTNIIDDIDQNCHTNDSSYPKAKKVLDINKALDRAVALILPASGTWQFDDSNQTDYPIIYTDLVAGQRDYSFIQDANGNLVLDIYKVQIKDEGGRYIDLTPVDQQGDVPNTMTDGNETQGTPNCYDKTGNGIFLDLVPSYSATNGLKIFINREPKYYVGDGSDDTTKPGFAGLFHEYLSLRSSYYYAFRYGLQNKNDLLSEMLRCESELIKYYGKRSRDEKKRFTIKLENNR